MIDLTSQDIPVEISTQILSAASFSIFADKFVFCEGAESSLDQKFLRAWYKDQRTAVIPVGSCRDVIRCTTSFRNNRLLANVTAIGIIDRDYWPDNFIEALPDGLNTLPVHEIESLFCYRTVFEAVAAHLGKQKPEADALYNEFLAEAKRKFDGAFLTKQISERFRARCEAQVRDRLNDLEIDADLVKVKANHCGALSQPIMDINLAGKIFDEESKRVEQALAGTEKEFLVVLPGKAYWGILTEKLGLEKSTYTDLIIDALRADDEADLSALGKSIRQKLEKIIPTVDQ